MITDVYTAIEQVPGTLEARENMAGIVKTYVEELAADPNAPDNVLMDIAVQNTRLSDLYGGLGIAKPWRYRNLLGAASGSGKSAGSIAGTQSR